MSTALVTNVKDLVDEAKYKAIITEMLAQAKQLGADEAEVGASCSQSLNTTVRMGEVENIEFNRDKGVGLTVYINQQKGSASTTDLSPEAIKATVEAAVHIAKVTEKDDCSGLADKASMARTFPDLDLYHPWNITVEEAKQIALDCEKIAREYDTRITNSDGTTLSTGQGYSLYANSHGFMHGNAGSNHSLSCVMIASDEHGMQRDYEYTIARNPKDLWAVDRVAKAAAELTLKRLSSQKIPTQHVPVIYQSNVASTLISHFLAAISGGALYRKASFLLGALNKQVFAKNINIVERPHIKCGTASAAFDGDGVATVDKDIVVDGILQTYLLSAYSARKLKMANTGHAGGVRNLIVETSNNDLAAILKQMDKGILVTELMGQGVNNVTGDYSRGAAGFWVENGKIQYPVHEITIAGNLKDMFQQIVTIGNDVDKRRNIQTGSIMLENMMVAGS